MKNQGKHSKLAAEFDLVADSYYAQHKENIAITGENPEYFSEYKVLDLAKHLKKQNAAAANILDFGSGIGNSVPHFRNYFPQSKLCCADVSGRSMQISQERFPGNETYTQIKNFLPLKDASFDVVFTACVFHHIPHEDHQHWLSELRRVTRPGGLIVIYEHNPLNPLTIRAVNTCPFDVNARLIRGNTMKQRALKSGWNSASIKYKLFFPSSLRMLRPLEPYLSRVFLGAQWRLIAQK